MPTLDNKKIIKQYQKFQVARTISLLPKQIVESWMDVLSLKLPKNYRRPQNIVISGMGGSNLASELIRSVYGKKIKSPLVFLRAKFTEPAFPLFFLFLKNLILESFLIYFFIKFPQEIRLF